MLKEINLERALQAYLSGENVRAMLPADADEGRVIPIEKLFDDARFLVDTKPALVNPEFEAAVQEMEAQIPPQESDGTDTGSPAGTKKQAGKRVGTGVKRKKIDTGKIMALRNAGWSNAKIADELGISETSVWNHLKKMEAKRDAED